MCQTSSVLERGVHCRVRPRVRVVAGTGIERVRVRWPWLRGEAVSVFMEREEGCGRKVGAKEVPWRSRR